MSGEFSELIKGRAASVTVYCASAVNIAPEYFQAARELGRELALRGLRLVTGAGKMGLMGAVNNAAIEAGGETLGVIPTFMVERNWHHRGLGRLVETDGMHRRKELMAALSCGAIALPGGVGTLEELLEIITWRQLGLFEGNVVVLNVNGYYDKLLAMLGTAVEQGFLNADHQRLWSVARTACEAVDMAVDPSPQIVLSAKF